MSESNVGLDHLLAFYAKRGYQRTVGFGDAPALVVIDFSCAFTRGPTLFPGGDFAAEMNETKRLLAAFRNAERPIFYTTIAYDDPERDAGLWGVKVPWLAHCAAGTDLVAIDPDLGALPQEPVIAKRFPSAFFDTDFEQRLRDAHADTLVIAGCTTSVCVRASAIDAMQRGFRPILAREAVGEFDAAIHALHLTDLHARYADVVAVDDVIAYVGGLARGRSTSP